MKQCARSQAVYELVVGGDPLPRKWDAHVADCEACQRAIGMASAFEEHLRRAALELTLPDLPDMRPTLSSVVQSRWRRTARVLTLAGASALVVLGTAVVLQLAPRAPFGTGGSPGEASPTEPIGASQEPSAEASAPSVSPSPVAERDGTLRRLPGFQVEGASLTAVVVEGSTVVVGGQSCDFEAGAEAGPCHPALWWSTDTEEWTPVDNLLSAGAESIRTIAAGPRGWAAMSAGETPVAWWSPDGRSWHAVEDLRAFEAFADGGPAMSGELCCNARVESIVATAEGFVATGQVTCSTCASRAAVWRSADGERWERVPYVSGFDAGPMRSIAEVDGRLVAVGGHAAWTSDDLGQTWDAWPTAFGGSAADAVVAWQAGFAAVGDADPLEAQDAALWVSATGTEWSLRSSVPNAEMDLLADTGQLVAAGRLLDEASPGIPMAWASADGRVWSSWDLEADGGRPGIGALAVFDGRLLAVGVADVEMAIPTAVIWTTPAP
jgi:hypothetical protein